MRVPVVLILGPHPSPSPSACRFLRILRVLERVSDLTCGHLEGVSGGGEQDGGGVQAELAGSDERRLERC